jgi:protein-disulfide isomerase
MSHWRRAKAVLDVVTTFAVLIAATAVIWTYWIYPQQSGPSRKEAVEDVADLTLEAARVSNVLGDSSIAIVEFSDFQCPYCGKYASETWPKVKSELIDAGKVRYVALQFPLESIHPLAMQAGEAAECAGRQGKYWEMHDQLFESKALTRDDLDRHAELLGLNAEDFRRCIDESETKEKVQADLKEGSRLGVRGTPALFIGAVQTDGSVKLLRRINGAASFELINDEVQKALDKNALVQREKLPQGE